MLKFNGGLGAGGAGITATQLLSPIVFLVAVFLGAAASDGFGFGGMVLSAGGSSSPVVSSIGSVTPVFYNIVVSIVRARPKKCVLVMYHYH
jgi:hypothetical protein